MFSEIIDAGALQQSLNFGIATASSEPKRHRCLDKKLLNVAGMMKSFCRTLYCSWRFTGPHNLPAKPGPSFNILRGCFMRQNVIRAGWGRFYSLDTVDDQDIYSRYNCETNYHNLIIYQQLILASAQIFEMSLYWDWIQVNCSEWPQKPACVNANVKRQYSNVLPGEQTD